MRKLLRGVSRVLRGYKVVNSDKVVFKQSSKEHCQGIRTCRPTQIDEAKGAVATVAYTDIGK